ncbi:MAG: DUF6565 domain-containing protein [Chitinophagales bacterium]
MGLFDKLGGSKLGGKSSGNSGASRFGGGGNKGNNAMFGGVDPEGKSSKGKSPIVLVVGLTVVVVLLASMLYFGGYQFLTSDTSTKKDYIHAYEAFVNNVSKNYLTYSVDAWTEADKDFQKFSAKLYKEYYPEMSLSEKMEVGKLPIMYHIFKYKSTIEREVAGSVVENTRELRNHLQDIISNTAEIYDGSYDQRIRNILDDFKAHGDYLPSDADNQPAGLGTPSKEGF